MAQELLPLVVTISLQIPKDRYTHIHKAAVQIHTYSRNTAVLCRAERNAAWSSSADASLRKLLLVDC